LKICSKNLKKSLKMKRTFTENEKQFWHEKKEIKFSELTEDQKQNLSFDDMKFTLQLIDKSIIQDVKITQVKGTKLFCIVGKRGNFINYKNSEIDFIENEYGFKIIFNQ